MSNFRAVATVTAALHQVLQEAVGADVAGADVTTVRPDVAANTPNKLGANLFLYQVMPNAALRNMDLPTRRADGAAVQRPRAAIDLHYLISFYGNDARLDQQLMLGSVVRTLNAHPVLSRQRVQDAIDTNTFLAGSNLESETELVRLTPLSLSLDEMGKLWSVFFQTDYALSVAYSAAVVLLEEDVAVREPKPVKERNVYVVPFRRPTITQVIGPAGAGGLIVPGDTLTLLAADLRGDATAVRVGETDIVPTSVATDRVTFTLPASPCAGPQPVRIVQARLMGTPEVVHPQAGVGSNTAAFVLHPVIRVDNTGNHILNTQNVTGTTVRTGEVVAGVSPTVGSLQRARLELLGGLDLAYAFDAVSRTTDVTELTFNFAGVAAGTYAARVRIDGAESAVQTDLTPGSPTFGQFVTPKLII